MASSGEDNWYPLVGEPKHPVTRKSVGRHASQIFFIATSWQLKQQNQCQSRKKKKKKQNEFNELVKLL
jgi:hypothetical protein